MSNITMTSRLWLCTAFITIAALAVFLETEAQRIRAALTYTVSATNAK